METNHSEIFTSRNVKIILCLLTALIMSCFTSACGSSTEQCKQRAKELLEQKYNKSFEISKMYPMKYGQIYYDVQAFAADMPKLRFVASIDIEDDNFSDNYVNRLVCYRISQKIGENLDDLPAYYYIYSHSLGFQAPADDPEISIEDYSKLASDFKVRTELYIVPEDLDVGKLYECLKKSYEGLECVNGNIMVYILDRGQMDSVREYIEMNDDLYGTYEELTEDFFTVFVPFNNGTIEISEAEFSDAIGEKL